MLVKASSDILAAAHSVYYFQLLSMAVYKGNHKSSLSMLVCSGNPDSSGEMSLYCSIKKKKIITLVEKRVKSYEML